MVVIKHKNLIKHVPVFFTSIDKSKHARLSQKVMQFILLCKK